MTTADNILKEVYEPRVRDQLQSEIITLSRIQKTSEGVSSDVGGKYVRFAVRVKRNHGIGARNEMEALPNPKTQDYRSAQLKLAYLYGAIQLSGQTFELAETNAQAFASVLDQEMEGIREGLKKDTNRQTYGTTTGILAVAASGSTTTLVTAAGAIMYAEIGMFVDVYDATDTNTTPVLNNANVEITDITESAGVYTITFGSSVTAVAAGDFITRTGSRGKETVGFQQIVAGITDSNALGTGGGALYNITHSTWTGNMDSTAGAISEGRMINLIDKVRTRGGTTTVGFCSLGVRRAYANLLEQQRRYVNTTKFTGGFSGIAFTTDYGEIPIVADFDCQPGRLYFMNEKELKLYQAGDWSFMNRDGSNWQRFSDSNGEYDAYRARLFKYCQLGTHRRNSHALMTSITEA